MWGKGLQGKNTWVYLGKTNGFLGEQMGDKASMFVSAEAGVLSALAMKLL